MDDCIFCKIVKGDIPCYKVYEDDKYLGFLDIKPLNIGNSLLIPKDHHHWVYDVPNFGQYFEIAKKIALETKNIVNAEAVSFLTLGYEVPHAHIRIIPRFPNDLHTHGIDTNLIVNQSKEDFVEISAKIFNLLK
ncbi:diadenosine tetraphosphate hydrolase [Candidatus Shapirobacteria bacterium CG_4_8_14_3_um_filter_35_11]|uniref:Diadenosine tetraphosphate hydrolase n=5 Tax=Candidatus Shapironibacteriota TaxID=1752721 RepID=A0A2M7XN65_9BACT|nr:MAG: diadenosine tetraphosphate hydrolase [Candidatus Shapirobacteria bacterium CG03_land_8_20_14_0_80_35_14]PIX68040.1 MAG: diadenosine tetraphosphate hydrolase [Candidatus Shapirobacteria bacterium CG_4_10_14_3_um_filter_35_13]PJA51017.1 MAG: diadenosine tetraphosphate hydrolase [Candidatus Shapirobacteria bacterium CG_4_9_14_3_um_filter_36_12]PJC79894.1 MAG: diadenosine tetraphosphate hydrolase [Candidatus Shapirobacteria bacterium CG_4_8_14_3_um_filter_35_11]PJE66836.1 MAG: diadenosine t